MELSFRTTDLRDLERFPAKAVELFGPAVAKVLAVRFADLRALPNSADLHVFGASPFTFESVAAQRLPLKDGYFLVVEVISVNRIKTLGIMSS